MLRRRRLWIGGVVVLALLAGFFATRGLPPPALTPPDSFSFAALGDAPYYGWEDLQYRLVLRDLEAHDLRWVLHVGDIFWRPCTDALYLRSLGWFNGLRHPVIYTPGDNEWADCWELGSGRFEPEERLRRIRQIFFSRPNRTLGGSSFPLVSQGGDGPFSEFVENVRWTHDGFVFATVHLVGSSNGLERFADPSPADLEATRRRTLAAADWLRQAFSQARAAGAQGVVLGFHGNPQLEKPPDHSARRPFEPFLTALEEEAETFGKPVLVVHGDDHEYTVDHPLVRRTTGRRLANLTRLQVPGSPQVGWVRIVVTPGAAQPFGVDARVLPRWKYW